MTVIARKWRIAGNKDNSANIAWPDRLEQIDGPWLQADEAVEVVPAAQLQGAVEDRDTLAAYLRWVVYKTGGAAPITYAEMEALLDRLSTEGAKKS